MRARSIRRHKLLDAEGAPAPPSTRYEIPFIRAFPNGTYRGQNIERPREVYEKACQFIAHGGRYLVAKMAEDKIELVAAMVDQADEFVEMGKETTASGQAFLDGVDRLVLASIAKLDSVQ